MLIYNFCAFAMQMPIGVIADKTAKSHSFAFVGIFLVCAAFFMLKHPVAAIVACGVGNGFFHIGGGIGVIQASEGKGGLLGVFVSPGAFGVYFGTQSGQKELLLALPIIIALLAASMPILTLAKKNTKPEIKPSSHSLDSLWPVACIFLVVLMRSWMGLSFNYPWKKIGCWGAAVVSAVVAGKAAGGFASDYNGPTKASLASLGGAAVLFSFSHVPVIGVASMFFFNMTMPISLWALAKLFDGADGFAFGMLAFALFLGYLPPYLSINLEGNIVYSLACALSLALLWTGLKEGGL